MEDVTVDAKTVTAMLVGIAIAEGRIRSIDDPVAAYVPELAGTEYGRTSLRHLLQMLSGLRFGKQHTGTDDVSRLACDTFLLHGAGGPSAVTQFYNQRTAACGTPPAVTNESADLYIALLREPLRRAVDLHVRSRDARGEAPRRGHRLGKHARRP